MELVKTNRKAFVILVAAVSAVILAGVVATASMTDTGGYSPNDRANHHPKHLTN